MVRDEEPIFMAHKLETFRTMFNQLKLEYKTVNGKKSFFNIVSSTLFKWIFLAKPYFAYVYEMR